MSIQQRPKSHFNLFLYSPESTRIWWLVMLHKSATHTERRKIAQSNWRWVWLRPHAQTSDTHKNFRVSLRSQVLHVDLVVKWILDMYDWDDSASFQVSGWISHRNCLHIGATRMGGNLHPCTSCTQTHVEFERLKSVAVARAFRVTLWIVSLPTDSRAPTEPRLFACRYWCINSP